MMENSGVGLPDADVESGDDTVEPRGDADLPDVRGAVRHGHNPKAGSQPRQGRCDVRVQLDTLSRLRRNLERRRNQGGVLARRFESEPEPFLAQPLKMTEGGRATLSRGGQYPRQRAFVVRSGGPGGSVGEELAERR